jgi:urease accessory protein
MTVPLHHPLPTLERARGAVALSVRRRDAVNAIDGLAQAGCGRLLFPAVARGEPLEAVLVNTSGGLTGGDRFTAEIAVGAGAAAVATTQACEKIYRSDGADALVETRLALAEGARLAWLPQETILFDRSRLVRRLSVDVAGNATLLLVEAVLLGRKASGEAYRDGLFRDSWRVRRGGRLVFAEEMRLAGPVGETIARRATLAGAVAFATVLAVGGDGDALRDTGRDLTMNKAIEVGFSSFDGLCVARLVAQDGAALRRALVPLLAALGGSVPRVWSL